MNTAIRNIRFHGDSLDRLMPMHLLISQKGRIQHVGPTLAKLVPETDFVGLRLLELFQLRRPRIANSMADLISAKDNKLHLQFRAAPFTAFKGLVVELPLQQGLLMNLSFGISVVDAVSDHDLTSADFAPTELAVEMLYLVEAKTAVMTEYRNLSMRLQGARVAAEEQAFTDTLTGLKNRRALDHVLSRLCNNPAQFSVMQLDLDFFKKVNDTFGHAAGDAVLQQVASLLVEETRPQDTVARVGGDEFVLIFDRLVDVQKLSVIGARIIERLEEPIIHDANPCQISGSIGVAMSTDYKTADAAAMLADADAALYLSKADGRGRVTICQAKQSNISPPAPCKTNP